MKAYRIRGLLITSFLLMFIVAYCDEPDYEIVGHWTKGQSHVFTVYTKITDMDKLQEFGETMPYVLGKNTSVYYFADKESTPDISKWPEDSWTRLILAMKDSEYFPKCTVWYDHLSSGDERIVPEPAKYLKDSLF
jgi:hypothetical protein